MLTVGDTLPAFQLKAVVHHERDQAFIDINNHSFPKKWLVLFFWPKDFTFVCPTEIVGFAKLQSHFKERDAIALGASTDSEFVHLAWRQHNDDLKHLSLPMLSDIKRELSTQLGILDQQEGVAKRAVFIIDPEGIIRFAMVTDLNVGRNPNEVLRVLDALQTDELCPCNWQKGEKTIDVTGDK